MRDPEKCLFRAEKICKSFGQVRALADFDIEICGGEIRGLVGENGSGKSTFSSIAAGMQKYDSGKMFLCGEEYHPGNTVDAMNHGISMVVQEQGTIPKISIAANIFFGKEAMFVQHGVLNVRKMNAEARRALENIGVTKALQYHGGGARGCRKEWRTGGSLPCLYAAFHGGRIDRLRY